MGAPRTVQPFSVKEMLELLSLAKTSAMGFRSVAARAEALERFRIAFLPFVEWLDKPIKECFVAFPEEAYQRAPKRAFPVFKQYGGGLYVVALDRKGNWITMERTQDEKSNPAKLMEISSAELAAKVEQARLVILDSVPWPRCTTHLKTIESLGLRPIVAHCAFLKYMEQGVEEVRRTITERESRIRIMRENLTFLASFAAGIDPLVYGARALKTYSVFSEYPGHQSRCTGTYLVRDLVQTQVDERNSKQQSGSRMSFSVFENAVRTDALRSFLDGILTSVEEATVTQGMFARHPISEEEAAVIRGFADSIGDT